ncbi:MAG: HAMP domain-containing histidine kinase [Erysipelotrichaceae bacterium]|nr:HAMP domain-containing histidine kinase [Erysipelotrichaceae bacterium]
MIGSIVAFFVSDAPLKPINTIMDVTDKIADGDYSVRIGLKRPESFQQLSDKFNHMAEELGSVEMLRKDFISNFSHEFKTPVSSIKGFAKELRKDNLTADQKEEYISIIIDESERLSALSENVLYLSKVENQTILTNKTNFNVTEQIRLAVSLLDHKLEEKSLDIELSGNDYYINGNEEMLKQVWINMLDNAIKFSPQYGCITIRLTKDKNHLIARFKNQGEQIPDESIEHLFDRFYQADRSHSTQGNGLGLTIVKRIIDLHNGFIDVQSNERETTFSVHLPL